MARARRLLGLLALVSGAALVLTTALAALGLVPLWRPTAPRPPATDLSAIVTPAAPPPRVERPAARVPVAPALTEPIVLPPSPPAAEGAALPDPGDTSDAAAGPGGSPGDEWAAALAFVTGNELLPLELTASPAPTAAPAPIRSPVPTVPPAPTVTRPPTLTPIPIALPVLPSPTPPPPGLPVRLVIPSIQVDTPVVELNAQPDDAGVLQWETVPFVAGHYRLTGPVGAPTNVVLSGHVVTRGLGNVFRDLYRLRPGDPIVVYTDRGHFTYRVSRLRVVKPEAVDVLAPSTEPRLTLITCAGEFDFRTRTFSERLVVVSDLVS
jgi:LPXTG-site transpeptidase (sortase) family protein